MLIPHSGNESVVISYGIVAAKVRTRSKPPNEIKKKGEFNHKKVEKQAKRLQGQAKNRSETNKSANSEPGADSEPRTNKEGKKTPQIIYASFREMKPIVLKNHPPSFWGLYIQGEEIIQIKKARQIT